MTCPLTYPRAGSGAAGGSFYSVNSCPPPRTGRRTGTRPPGGRPGTTRSTATAPAGSPAGPRGRSAAGRPLFPRRAERREEGVGQHHRGDVVVPLPPRPPLEVVRAQLL